ncbi:hypothetical protein [Bacillus sp. REN3]|uniref:hypothetical protein n=1 Tax=Bacillus sp. REN3 TaxID=2802440 RepID=UPI001AEEF36C|nr:hypothetical protein [Bacillus sp. REN3]
MNRTLGNTPGSSGTKEARFTPHGKGRAWGGRDQLLTIAQQFLRKQPYKQKTWINVI